MSIKPLLYSILFCILFSLQMLSAAEELRGAWIHYANGMKGKNWDESVRLLSENGFNTLFANLLWAGAAEYPSAILPSHKDLTTADGKQLDRVQECLDACRKYNIQCHAWVVVCNLGYRTPAEFKKRMLSEGMVLLDDEGKSTDFLAPYIPENRQRICKAICELAQKYPIDGIHLDYVRYPFKHGAYNDNARAPFEEFLGKKVDKWPDDCKKNGKLNKEFLQWRCDVITQLVKEIHDELKKVRPDCTLSAAVYGHWPSSQISIAQDPKTWVDKGLVDFLIPMNYSRERWECGAWLRQQISAIHGKVPIYHGIGNYLMKNSQVAMQQIEDSRRCGADGFVCFQFNDFFLTNHAKALRKELASSPPGSPSSLFAHNEVSIPHQWLPQENVHFWRFVSKETMTCRFYLPISMQNIAPEQIKAYLHRNGKQVVPLEAHARLDIKNQEIDLSFYPDKPGYYRWELLYTTPQDTPRLHSWKSETVFCH